MNLYSSAGRWVVMDSSKERRLAFRRRIVGSGWWIGWSIIRGPERAWLSM